MRLYAKMKKTLLVTTVAALVATSMPVYANDYTNHWAEKAITKWSEEGILVGFEDGTFRPEDHITRAQLAQIISGIFGLQDITGGKEYKDVAANEWYAHGVNVVAAAGIMNDYEDGTFRPDEYATREEAAYAIARAYRMAATNDAVDFTDKAQIAEWAEDEVAALVAGDVLAGYPDGSFAPQGNLKRSEVVSMIDRITADLVNDKGIYSQDIEGNLVVNTADVTLKDMTVTGNLYLAEGIGEGDVTLDGVTVLGDVIVEGGGANTVHVKGKSVINNIIVDKTTGETPRILVSSQVVVNGEVVLETTVVLEGENAKLPKIVVTGAGEVKIKGQVEVASINILKPVALDIAKDVKVETVAVAETASGVAITGKGEITGKVTIDGNGAKLEVKVDKNNVTTGSGVTEKPVVTPPTTGGGGGGGGGNGGNHTSVSVDKFIVTLEGKDAPVEVEVGGVIDVVVNQNSILVEGKPFNATDKIKTIKVEANVTELVVAYMNSSVYKVELRAGKSYTPSDLLEIIQTEDAAGKTLVDKAKAFIAEFGGNILTAKQIQTVNDKIDEYYEELEETLSADSVSVSTIINQAKKLEGALESAKYQKHHETIKKLADAIGIKITGINVADIETLTAKGSVITVDDKGSYYSTTYTVNGTYNGVKK